MSDFSCKPVSLDEINVGMTASYSQTITDHDIKNFAGLSGDYNPVHVSDEYIQSSRFRKRVVHGLMPTSFFSGIFGMRLPGPGCLYVSQAIEFKRPIYIDDTVTAKVEVIEVDLVTRHVKFRTTCSVKNKVVIDGLADIFIPKDV
ncbi:MaoC family dehydratase [Candidatus Electrothrix sp.]|uniref:MaoC family dehydratase n=1 Tax=Candidatus Electrothrix sp. TaxID=2170559 RepID=UPI004055C943